MKKITLLFTLFILSITWQSNSQVTIGTGNDGGTFESPPLNAYYGFSYGQSIYLASEINASGNITSVDFQLVAGTDISSADDMVDVWIGYTTKSIFDSTSDWIDVSTLTQVLTNGTMTSVNDVLTITFSSPFAYNGTDNLVIAVDANESGFGSSTDRVLATDGPTSAMSLMQRSDSTNSDPTSPEVGVLFQSRGNITFNGITQSCPTPISLAASVTTITASLNWTENGTATTWNVEWGTDGFTQGAGTIITGASNPQGISSLSDNTSYDFYVQADCGGGDLSNWAGPFSFATVLAAIVPDYINDFSTYPGTGWTESEGAYNIPDLNDTTSAWTGDDFGNDAVHANGSCAKMNIYTTTHDEYLISPEFDLSASDYYLNFDLAFTEWNNTNPGVWDTDDYVALLVTQDGTSWSELTRWDSSSTIAAAGEAVSEITLSGYNATTKFAFFVFSDIDNGPDNDFFIDNFQITTTSLSVEDNVIEGFEIYPNPVNDMLRFNAQDDIKSISIYNLLGQEVLRTQPRVSNTEVNMSNLPTGMYVVKVQVGEQLGSYRIIKE